jgi:hypothetical protein
MSARVDPRRNCMPAPAVKEAGRITDGRGLATDKAAADEKEEEEEDEDEDEDEEDITREDGEDVEPECSVGTTVARENGSVRLPRFRPDKVEFEAGVNEANDAGANNEVWRALRLPGGDGMGRCDFSRSSSPE